MLSTKEAEYMVVTEAFKKAIWLVSLIDDLDIFQKHVDAHCNSQNDIESSKNQVYQSRMKHIDVWFYFVRKILDEDDIFLKKHYKYIDKDDV